MAFSTELKRSLQVALCGKRQADELESAALNVAGVAVPYTSGSNLVGVDGTGSNAAPLAGTEARLDALDTALQALLTSLRNAGVIAS